MNWHKQKQERKRYPDAHSVKKGYQWHFGYKSHIGVDKNSRLIHHLEVTSANEHDITITPKLIHGEKKKCMVTAVMLEQISVKMLLSETNRARR